MQLMKKLSILWISLCFALPVFAQVDSTRVLSGMVTVQGSQSRLSDVVVFIKGTSFGTYSDVNGNYKVRLSPSERTLIFSAIGYISQEVSVDDHQIIDVSLNPDPYTLPELKVTGYVVPHYSRRFRKALKKRQRQKATYSLDSSSISK